jgi:hypothetical protein
METKQKFILGASSFIVLFSLYFAMKHIDNIVGFNNFTPDFTGTCIEHKYFYEKEIRCSIVIHKGLDKSNHAIPRIFINTFDDTLEVHFNTGFNDSDFNKILVGDTLTKEANSFNLTINRTKNFLLKFKCDYNTP